DASRGMKMNSNRGMRMGSIPTRRCDWPASAFRGVGDHRLLVGPIMPQLAQGLQPRAPTIGILAGRIAHQDEPVGLCGVNKQALSLQTLAAQQGSLRLQIVTLAAATLGL